MTNYLLWSVVVALSAAEILFIWKLYRGKTFTVASLNDTDRINLSLNSVMFILAVVSILIALAAFQDSKSSGEAQQKALERSRDSLQNVVTALENERVLLANAQGTLSAQLDVSRKQQQAMSATNSVLQGTRKTLQSQLDISTEQNRRELETLNRKPRVQFSLGLIPEEGFREGIDFPVQSADGIKLTVTNLGDLALANPTLSISAQPTTVKVLSAGIAHLDSDNRLQFNAPNIVQSLEPASQIGGGYLFKFDLFIPDGVNEITLTFRIYGTNMPVHESKVDLHIIRPTDAK